MFSDAYSNPSGSRWGGMCRAWLLAYHRYIGTGTYVVLANIEALFWGSCDPHTEASSSMQRPSVWFWPVILFPVTSELSYTNKAIKQPKRYWKKEAHFFWDYNSDEDAMGNLQVLLSEWSLLFQCKYCTSFNTWDNNNQVEKVSISRADITVYHLSVDFSCEQVKRTVTFLLILLPLKDH